MANVVEYLEPIKIVYTTNYNVNTLAINSVDEFIEITPVAFDGKPAGDDLRALPDECRIEMRETGMYFLCIASDTYGRSAAKVGNNLAPFYSASGIAFAFNGGGLNAVTSSLNPFENYKYLYVYKQPDGRGYRLARCNTYVALPEDQWKSISSYAVNKVSPGDYVAFEGADEPDTTATVITYNGSTIATLEAGQTATIKTAETEVEHDIVITPVFPIEIAYGDIIATAEAGQTATVKCANTEADFDIVVSAKAEEDDITDLTGTWLLNEVLMPTESGVSLDVNFNSTNSSGVAYEYNSLQRAYWGTVWKLSYIYSGNYMHTAYQEDTGWKDVAYRTITITSTLAEVTNGQELLEWLKANATKQ